MRDANKGATLEDALLAVFPWLLAGNPADAFRLFNLIAIEAATGDGWMSAPGTLSLPVAAPVYALAVWTIALLAMTVIVFRRKEP